MLSSPSQCYSSVSGHEPRADWSGKVLTWDCVRKVTGSSD